MSEDIPIHELHQGVNHYYGDTVRILFVIGAVLILASEFMSAPFLSPVAALILSIALVIAAGLTNPVQVWIQWVNLLLSGISVALFGIVAFVRYKESSDITMESLVLLLLVVLFVIALYLSTKNIRGILMRDAPFIE